MLDRMPGGRHKSTIDFDVEDIVRTPDHTLDLAGLKCPLPALKTAKFLKSLSPGATLTVRCTDPMAVIDIPALLNETGDELAGQDREGAVYLFHICRRGKA